MIKIPEINEILYNKFILNISLNKSILNFWTKPKKKNIYRKTNLFIFILRDMGSLRIFYWGGTLGFFLALISVIGLILLPVVVILYWLFDKNKPKTQNYQINKIYYFIWKYYFIHKYFLSYI